MSNVTVVRHHARHRRAVDRWLRRHADPAEVFTTRLGRERLVVVSRDVHAGVRGHRFHRGVKVSGDMLTFTHSPEDPQATGCFVELDWNEASRVRVRRDAGGSVRLLATQGAGLSAASDSLAVLASLRGAVGLPVTLDEEPLWARSILHLVTAQQMSDATVFREIAFVPAGRHADLVPGGWEPTPPAHPRPDAGDGGYRDLVRRGAGRLAGLVAAAAGERGGAGATAELALSGGRDSRTVLAAAHRTGAPVVCASLLSTVGTPEDYVIARDLAGTYGFDFEGSDVGSFEDDQVAVPSKDDRLTLWGSTSAGLYDGFGTRRTAGWTDGRVRMNGLGGEANSGSGNGWRPWADFAHAVTPASRHNTPRGIEEFMRAGHRGLRAAGHADDDPVGAQLMYVHYRSGIHGAAAQVGVSMACLRPLENRALTLAGFHERSARLITDATLLLSPGMVERPYDRPDRHLTHAVATERLAELGGAITDDEIPRFTVVGSATDLVDGPSALGLSIARSIGMRGDFPDATTWIHDDLDLVPADLRPVYEEIAANGRWRATKFFDGNVYASGPSVPKAASLRLLRLLT